MSSAKMAAILSRGRWVKTKATDAREPVNKENNKSKSDTFRLSTRAFASTDVRYNIFRYRYVYKGYYIFSI